jgi:hypothetical protein
LYCAKRRGRNRVANYSLPSHSSPAQGGAADDEDDTEITRVSALPGR